MSCNGLRPRRESTRGAYGPPPSSARSPARVLNERAPLEPKVDTSGNHGQPARPNTDGRSRHPTSPASWKIPRSAEGRARRRRHTRSARRAPSGPAAFSAKSSEEVAAAWRRPGDIRTRRLPVPAGPVRSLRCEAKPGTSRPRPLPPPSLGNEPERIGRRPEPFDAPRPDRPERRSATRCQPAPTASRRPVYGTTCRDAYRRRHGRVPMRPLTPAAAVPSALPPRWSAPARPSPRRHAEACAIHRPPRRGTTRSAPSPGRSAPAAPA